MKLLSLLASAVFLTVQAADTASQAFQAQGANQTHLDRLNNYSGNKLVLLGDWKPEEIAKWNELLSSEGVYEYDFKWLGRHQTPLIFYSDTGKKSFDAWVIEQSGFPGSRWVAFDSSNNVIASGISVPDVKILTSAIEKAGVISAPKQLRAFLSEHPEHIDARVDLLKEARRRALLATPGCGYGVASVPSCGYGIASVPSCGYGIASVPSCGYGIASVPSAPRGSTLKKLNDYIINALYQR